MPSIIDLQIAAVMPNVTAGQPGNSANLAAGGSNVGSSIVAALVIIFLIVGIAMLGTHQRSKRQKSARTLLPTHFNNGLLNDIRHPTITYIGRSLSQASSPTSVRKSNMDSQFKVHNVSPPTPTLPNAAFSPRPKSSGFPAPTQSLQVPETPKLPFATLNITSHITPPPAVFLTPERRVNGVSEECINVVNSSPAATVDDGTVVNSKPKKPRPSAIDTKRNLSNTAFERSTPSTASRPYLSESSSLIRKIDAFIKENDYPGWTDSTKSSYSSPSYIDLDISVTSPSTPTSSAGPITPCDVEHATVSEKQQLEDAGDKTRQSTMYEELGERLLLASATSDTIVAIDNDTPKSKAASYETLGRGRPRTNIPRLEIGGPRITGSPIREEEIERPVLRAKRKVAQAYVGKFDPELEGPPIMSYSTISSLCDTSHSHNDAAMR